MTGLISYYHDIKKLNSRIEDVEANTCPGNAAVPHRNHKQYQNIDKKKRPTTRKNIHPMFCIILGTIKHYSSAKRCEKRHFFSNS